MLSQAYCVIIFRGVSEPGHDREVLYGLNTTGKIYISQLMTNMKLPGSKGYVTQMVMHYKTSTADFSLAWEFQKYVSNAAHRHGVIYQGKYKQQTSKQKKTEQDHHVHKNAEVVHKDVKILWNTNYFPSLNFCGPHTKLHGVRGLSKHYHMKFKHMIFNKKLGHGICAIFQITCDCD